MISQLNTWPACTPVNASLAENLKRLNTLTRRLARIVLEVETDEASTDVGQ